METSHAKRKNYILNGVSSSGKSTLSKALTTKLPDFFHLSYDDFDLLIERMEDREKEKLIPVPTEHFFPEMIKMFSDLGNQFSCFPMF
jgi:chloramphenicol 3-O phosphotransferase